MNVTLVLLIAVTVVAVIFIVAYYAEAKKKPPIPPKRKFGLHEAEFLKDVLNGELTPEQARAAIVVADIAQMDFALSKEINIKRDQLTNAKTTAEQSITGYKEAIVHEKRIIENAILREEGISELATAFKL